MMKLQNRFKELCEKPSDINEHLPTLREYADKCDHVTEMGVRHCVSSYAFLTSKAKTIVGYDIAKQPEVDKLSEECLEDNRAWEFNEIDVLKATIKETDFLFIDTFHSATQLARELERHASSVKKYLGFHDTTTFWERGEEDNYGYLSKDVNCGRGLRYAIEPFLATHPEWKQVYRTEANNGLLILERIA